MNHFSLKNFPFFIIPVSNTLSLIFTCASGAETLTARSRVSMWHYKFSWSIKGTFYKKNFHILSVYNFIIYIYIYIYILYIYIYIYIYLMHHMDTYKIHWEKVFWEQYKNDAFCLEQILEAIPHKRAAVRPSAFHFANQTNMMGIRCGVKLEKKERTLWWRSFMDSCTWTTIMVLFTYINFVRIQNTV